MRLDADHFSLRDDAPDGVTLGQVYLGPAPVGLGSFQVAVATSASPLSKPTLRALLAARKSKTQVQVVGAVVHGRTAHMMGPDPQAMPVEMPINQAERQLQSVLLEPNAVAAGNRLAAFRMSAH